MNITDERLDAIIHELTEGPSKPFWLEQVAALKELKELRQRPASPPVKVWTTAKGKYASGEDLSLGKVRVGWAGYSNAGPRDDPNKYAASVLLPGLNPINERYSTQEAAKARVEHTVGVWLAAAGLPTLSPSR